MNRIEKVMNLWEGKNQFFLLKRGNREGRWEKPKLKRRQAWAWTMEWEGTGQGACSVTPEGRRKGGAREEQGRSRLGEQLPTCAHDRHSASGGHPRFHFHQLWPGLCGLIAKLRHDQRHASSSSQETPYDLTDIDLRRIPTVPPLHSSPISLLTNAPGPRHVGASAVKRHAASARPPASQNQCQSSMACQTR